MNGTVAMTSSFLPPFAGYGAMVPAIILLLGIFWALFADRLPGRDRGAAVVGTVTAALAALAQALVEPGTVLFGVRFGYTPDARFAATALCALAALWCLWIVGSGRGRIREAVALALCSALGGSFAVASLDLIVMVLALELCSMPAYVLIGYRRYRIRGLEGALKYFLLSVMTSLIMFYGLSFLVGLGADTSFFALTQLPDTPLTMIAFGMLLLGIFAKLSAAPFHWWAPDAYEGSESWTVAFASTVPKVAGVVVAVRLVTLAAQSVALIGPFIFVIAIASMVLGSFAALMQRDIRRMMAYSGVVNMGFALMAVAVTALGGATAQTAFYFAALFAVSYALPTLGILLISEHEGPRVADLSGLSERRPAAAWALAAMTLSLIGVPPLFGFFAKLNLFLITVAAGQAWIVVVAVVLTVVSAFYYIRLIRAAFFGETPADIGEKAPTADEAAEEKAEECVQTSRYSVPATVTLALVVVAILVMGILSQPILAWLTNS